MNWAIKIISKTLMTKISLISWEVSTKAFTIVTSYHMFLETSTWEINRIRRTSVLNVNFQFVEVIFGFLVVNSKIGICENLRWGLEYLCSFLLSKMALLS